MNTAERIYPNIVLNNQGKEAKDRLTSQLKRLESFSPVVDMVIANDKRGNPVIEPRWGKILAEIRISPEESFPNEVVLLTYHGLEKAKIGVYDYNYHNLVTKNRMIPDFRTLTSASDEDYVKYESAANSAIIKLLETQYQQNCYNKNKEF